MISTYFVVALSSGNIIRIIRRNEPPDDTATVFHVPASAPCVYRYEALHAQGLDLISLNRVSHDEAL